VKIVVDTNVLVAGLYSSLGASYRMLDFWIDGKLDIYASTAVWLEYEDVLKRLESVRRHGFSNKDIDILLNQFAVHVTPIRLNYLWRPQLRDPKDEMILEAAVNAPVDAIVTHNVSDFELGAKRFGVRTLTPASFLKLEFPS
jgi:putative PIN family toxin of toxin-antitoxin system